MADEDESKKVDGAYMISGVRVKFPYTAYPSQLVYMEKVIEALEGVRDHDLFLFNPRPPHPTND